MVRRLGTLWILGILHATLLWAGDIVSIYAPMGLALCWLVWLDRRVLITLGIIAEVSGGFGAGLALLTGLCVALALLQLRLRRLQVPAVVR